jgi:hypothetical protein
VRPGDRLFPGEERSITSTFMPSEPKRNIQGTIIDVPRGVTQIGKYDVVTIEQGPARRSRRQCPGHLQAGETVRDRSAAIW